MELQFFLTFSSNLNLCTYDNIYIGGQFSVHMLLVTLDEPAILSRTTVCACDPMIKASPSSKQPPHPPPHLTHPTPTLPHPPPYTQTQHSSNICWSSLGQIELLSPHNVLGSLSHCCLWILPQITVQIICLSWVAFKLTVLRFQISQSDSADTRSREQAQTELLSDSAVCYR